MSWRYAGSQTLWAARDGMCIKLGRRGPGSVRGSVVLSCCPLREQRGAHARLRVVQECPSGARGAARAASRAPHPGCGGEARPGIEKQGSPSWKPLTAVTLAYEMALLHKSINTLSLRYALWYMRPPPETTADLKRLTSWCVCAESGEVCATRAGVFGFHR